MSNACENIEPDLFNHVVFFFLQISLPIFSLYGGLQPCDALFINTLEKMSKKSDVGKTVRSKYS